MARAIDVGPTRAELVARGWTPPVSRQSWAPIMFLCDAPSPEAHKADKPMDARYQDFLVRFAERHGVGPGWRLLTAAPAVMERIKNGLFYTPAHAATHQQDCSMGLIRYGNEPAGLWGSVPTRSDPAAIVERLSWVRPRPFPTGRPRRRGPRIRTA